MPTVVINLNEKTPDELKRMLGSVIRDPEREKRLLADIEAGRADIDDIGN